jgi:AMIN domain-containing protein
MKSFSYTSSNLALVLAAASLVPITIAAQSTPQVATTQKLRTTAQAASAAVLVVRVVPDKNGPAVEIISTRPLVPDVQKLDGPPRLVIDLPNTSNSLQPKQVDFQPGAFHSDPVRAVRIDQFQKHPPVTRVVIDLLKNTEFTWDLAGNLLTVRLRSTEEAPKPASVAGLSSEARPVVVPVSSGGAGVAVSLDRFSSGSTVTAGADTQILNLGRGGEVRVCPGTTLSVTNSSNGQDLLFGMSTGAFEAHYTLQSSADSVVTPDFRILLEGPGEFHYAISADSRGNTCMRPLPGNTASAMVSELIGDEKYEVRAGEQVVFRSGSLSAVDVATPADCGCPPASIPVLRASSEMAPAKDSSDPVHLAQARTPAPMNVASATPETTPLPPSNSQETHIQIEAPLVFRASDLPPAHSAVMPEAHSLSASDSMTSTRTPATILPAAPHQTHPGFFGRVKGFFTAIFR